jgi:hypothetical protein
MLVVSLELLLPVLEQFCKHGLHLGSGAPLQVQIFITPCLIQSMLSLVFWEVIHQRRSLQTLGI